MASAGAESRRAVVLVSGGIDSATALALAREQGFACYCLSVDYGQRHRLELEAARRVTESLGAVEHRCVVLDVGWMGGSALTDRRIDVPDAPSAGIPVTYVPARNTMLLAMALAWGEALGARDIYYGANAIDYSGYPDCRPAFVEAFEHLANVATKAGVEGERFRIHAPLIAMSKAEIIRTGTRLGVDYGLTLSCYQPSAAGEACGQCDSCRLRAQGFAGAGIADPTRYRRK
jgi:7-cyano-7-deazaguanine synthase